MGVTIGQKVAYGAAFVLGSSRITMTEPLSSAELGLRALRLLEEALDLLDQSDSSEEIGAHVDLAVHRLRAVLAKEGPIPPRR